jgi:hypothetical protein
MSWLDIVTALGSVAVLVSALLHPLHSRDDAHRRDERDPD